MKYYQIDLLCLQETRAPKAEHFTHDGFQVILSGKDADRCSSGVGFVVSPFTKRYVGGFLQLSERLASITIRAARHCITFISAYAPHNGHPYDVRSTFYQQLGSFFDQSSNGRSRVYVLGDLNARIGSQMGGEHEFFGPYTYGRQVQSQNELSNRDLLSEFCIGHDACVANTYQDVPLHQKVTFFHAGMSPMEPIRDSNFAMLDLVLCLRSELCSVRGLQSVREATLATDHFLGVSSINCTFEHCHASKKTRKDFTNCWNPILHQRFCQTFCDSYQCMRESRLESSCHPDMESFHGGFSGLPSSSAVQHHSTRSQAPSHSASADATLNADNLGVSSRWASLADALHTAEGILPNQPIQSRKRWVSQRTLDLITQRASARAAGNYTCEKALQRSVRKSVKRDKRDWLDLLVSGGSWADLRFAFKPKARSQGRLSDKDGCFVSSERRADTLADYFEHDQWGKRASDVSNLSSVEQSVNLDMREFTLTEVRSLILAMKRNKAAGPNGVFAEHLRYLSRNEDCLQVLVNFPNFCWISGSVPEQWHLAYVTAIYKKGIIHDPANYRPISLLDVGYKLFASLLRQRLVSAGAEERLSSQQFGFRKGHSTQDAIFILRRRVELAHAQRNGQLYVLALDWAKAFDSLEPSAMLAALRRFGLPPDVLKIIEAIYTDRVFRVAEGGTFSTTRQQHSGISQGCPLSPFLSIMVMSIIMQDAASSLLAEDQKRLAEGTLGELLYADDTLLLSVSSTSLSRFMSAVSACGNQHGLQLHWGKLQLMNVRTSGVIKRPDGTAIEPTNDIVYLGASISDDGRVGKELARRLGMAQREFICLTRIWKHCSLPRQRKMQIFNAMVLSKLVYGLATAWLGKNERSRLDGFQSRCLRSILNIPVAVVSRVSNAAVLQQAAQSAVTSKLLEYPLLLLGKVARMPSGSSMRDATFCLGTLRLAVERYVRRVGRPRLDWTTELMKISYQIAGPTGRVETLFYDEVYWKCTVRQFSKHT